MKVSIENFSFIKTRKVIQESRYYKYAHLQTKVRTKRRTPYFLCSFLFILNCYDSTNQRNNSCTQESRNPFSL